MPPPAAPKAKEKEAPLAPVAVDAIFKVDEFMAFINAPDRPSKMSHWAPAKKQKLDEHIRQQIKKSQTTDFKALDKWFEKFGPKDRENMEAYLNWFNKKLRAAKTAEEGKKK